MSLQGKEPVEVLQKCRDILGYEDFLAPTPDDYSEWVTEWTSNNQESLRALAANIRFNLLAYNKIIDETAGLDGRLKFTNEEIVKWSNPANFSAGGDNGYGFLESDSEFLRLIGTKRAGLLREEYVPATISQEITDNLYELISSTHSNGLFRGQYNTLRDEIQNLSYIRLCQSTAAFNEALTKEALGNLTSDIFGDSQALEKYSEDFADFFTGQETLGNIQETSQFFNKSLGYKEQCFLLANIYNLAIIKKGFDVNNSKFITVNALIEEFPDILTQDSTGQLSQETFYFLYNNLGTAIDNNLARGYAGNAAENVPAHGLVGGNYDLTSFFKKLPTVDPDVWYSHSSVLIDGEPFGFMNKLTQSPNKNAFYEMFPEEISSLQPMIRLFKVISEDDGCAEKEVEITFDSHAPFNIEDILSDLDTRNPGVGLKSFNFTYDGNNPFAVKKSISANLTIFANSFHELLEDRVDGKSGEIYKYIDLVLKTGEMETVRFNNLDNDVVLNNIDKLNFRLKAVVGWRNPIYTGAGREIFRDEVLEAINDQSITLNLTPTIHDFKLDDSGRVVLTIQYLAYSEDYYDNPAFNIFSDPEASLSMLFRNLRYRKFNKACNIDELNELKSSREEEERIRQEKGKALRGLMMAFMKSGKIYSIPIKDGDIPFYGYDGDSQAGVLSLKDIATKITNTAQTIDVRSLADDVDGATSSLLLDPDERDNEIDPSENKLENKVNFIFVGDVVDIILSELSKNIYKIQIFLEILVNREKQEFERYREQLGFSLFSYDTIINSVNTGDLRQELEKYRRFYSNLKRFRLTLGPTEILKPKSYESTSINLGDIAISVKNLLEWLTTKIADKNLETFTLPAFMNTFFQNFVVDFLNNDSCYRGKAKQKISLFENTITDYGDTPEDEDTVSKLCHTPYGLGATPETLRSRCPATGVLACSRRLFLPNQVSDVLPVFQTMGVRGDIRTHRGICQEFNYLIYYAGRSAPSEKLKGIKVEDQANGIWHYQIGRDRGIVKDISLSKTTSTGLAEVRYEQDGYDGLRQLRVLYDVTIKTFLDISIFPGTYIYVEPRGFDPAMVDVDGVDLTQLGIGGYCMVWKSEHSISSDGSPETTIHAKWVSGIYVDNEEVTEHNQLVSNNSKCDAT